MTTIFKNFLFFIFLLSSAPSTALQCKQLFQQSMKQKIQARIDEITDFIQAAIEKEEGRLTDGWNRNQTFMREQGFSSLELLIASARTSLWATGLGNKFIVRRENNKLSQEYTASESGNHPRLDINNHVLHLNSRNNLDVKMISFLIETGLLFDFLDRNALFKISLNVTKGNNVIPIVIDIYPADQSTCPGCFNYTRRAVGSDFGTSGTDDSLPSLLR